MMLSALLLIQFFLYPIPPVDSLPPFYSASDVGYRIKELALDAPIKRSDPNANNNASLSDLQQSVPPGGALPPGGDNRRVSEVKHSEGVAHAESVQTTPISTPTTLQPATTVAPVRYLFLHDPFVTELRLPSHLEKVFEKLASKPKHEEDLAEPTGEAVVDELEDVSPNHEGKDSRQGNKDISDNINIESHFQVKAPFQSNSSNSIATPDPLQTTTAIPQPPSAAEKIAEIISTAAVDEGPPTTKSGRRAPFPDVIAVMFYAHWCPHCHKAAPIWSQVARGFRCTPNIKFYAFECASAGPDRLDTPKGPTPYDICVDQEVPSFPALQVYSQVPEGVVLDKNLSLIGGFRPNNKPKILSNGATLVQLPTLAHSEDSLPPPPGLQVQRKLIQVKSRSVSQFRRWFLANSTIDALVPCTQGDRFGSPGDRLGNLSNIPVPSIVVQKRWDGQIQSCSDGRLHDSLVALGYLLRNWVTGAGEFLPVEKNAELRHFLQIAAALAPGLNVRNELFRLHEMLNQNAAVPLEGRVYQAAIDNLDLAGIKIKPSGEDPDFINAPQLTSAIWLLLHTLTASVDAKQRGLLETAAPRRRFLFKAESCPSVPLPSRRKAGDFKLKVLGDRFNKLSTSVGRPTPYEVAAVFRSTIDSFFGCEVCRLHFITFFDRCYASRCSWIRDGTSPYVESPQDSDGAVTSAYDGLLLWLWRFHNTVTFRTAVEQTADSIVTRQQIIEARDGPSKFVSAVTPNELVSYDGVDVRFPPENICSDCRRKNVDLSHFNKSSCLNTDLVGRAVALERVLRGMDEEEIGKEIPPQDDIAYDAFEDFDLIKVREFSRSYFWNDNWNDDLLSLRWNPVKTVFDQIYAD